MNKKKRNDIILICVFILIAFVAILLMNILSNNGSMAVVILDGKEIGRYSLNEDREVRIECDQDEYNILVIEESRAFIKESNCHSQDCVKHAKVWRTDESIVCLPHKLVIAIEEG
jgi:hypothetical protein